MHSFDCVDVQVIRIASIRLNICTFIQSTLPAIDRTLANAFMHIYSTVHLSLFIYEIGIYANKNIEMCPNVPANKQ